MPGSRWDTFAGQELRFLAEAVEAAYFSSVRVDVPLWLELLAVMDARDVGTEQDRLEMRGSVEEARRPLSQRITWVDRPLPPGSVR